jgi:hypothetical protein
VTAVEGIDFAWSQPTPSQVKAVGAHWVAGYFSTDSSKDLNRSNIPGFLAAGLGVVTVWETTTGRATQGYQAGVDDARAAEAQRSAAGLPGDHVHYFAVDEDTSWSSVQAYFDGAVSVLGIARVGCYGGYPVITGAHGHGIKYLWQTVAWSNGQWASFASIRQTGGTLLGGNADLDYAEVPDFGQTPRPSTPEVDMPLTTADVDLFLATKVPLAKLPGGYVPSVAELLNGSKTADDQLAALGKTIGAQGAAITALVTQLGAQHSGVDTAAVVSAVQAAIAAAVVHVDVAVTQPPAAP